MTAVNAVLKNQGLPFSYILLGIWLQKYTWSAFLINTFYYVFLALFPTTCLNTLCSFPDFFLSKSPKAYDKDEMELGSNSKLKLLIILSLALIRDENYFLKWYPVNGQNSFLIKSVRRKCWVLPCGLISINGSWNGFSVGLWSKS